MRRRRYGAIGIVVGCCLLLACSGCRRPKPRHGLLLRGDWSLEINRVPWLKDRSTNYGEYSQPPEGCGVPAAPLRDCEAGFPTDALPEPPDLDQIDSDSSVSMNGCGTCGKLFQVGWLRGGRTYRREEVPVQVGYYNHPRFHPVPTRPVFSSAATAVPAVHTRLVPQRGSLPATPPSGLPQRIEVTPPAPVPEEIRTPQPEVKTADPVEDRVTEAPRRLSLGRTTRSWIFNPSGIHQLEPPPETRISSQSQGRSIRR